MTSSDLCVEEAGRYSAKTIVGRALEAVCAQDESLAVLYADVGRRFGLSSIADHCFEVGISEQSMIGLAAGFAASGRKAVAISYAPFITSRVEDQLRVFVGDMNMPLCLIGSASGFSAGDLGPQLTSLDDLAITRCIPNLQVVCPADNFEAYKAIVAAAASDRAVYVRLTGGRVVKSVYPHDYPFQIGKAVTLRQGDDIVLFSTGTVTAHVCEAAEILAEQGLSCSVINMHTIKPLDEEVVRRVCSARLVVTVEEHNVIGGLGSAVAELLAEMPSHPRLHRIGVNDEYLNADTSDALLQKSGLAADQIARRVASAINR